MTDTRLDGDEGVLRAYLAEIRATPLLTPEEEVALAERIQTGDIEAFHALVRANLRFVVNVVKKYRRSGMPLLDLINEGNIGLIRAAKKFNPKLGLRFISYAVWWIRNRLSLFLARNGGVLSLPARKISLVYQLEATYQRLFARLKREPVPEELAAELELSAREVFDISHAVRGYVSLEKLLRTEEGTSLESLLADRAVSLPERHLSLLAFRERLERLMDCLKPRERRALVLYYGLDGEEWCKTFAEVGRRMDLSRESARLLFHRAIRKLSRHPDVTGLRDYWDAG